MERPTLRADIAVAVLLLPVTALITVWLGANVLFSGDSFGAPGPRTAEAARHGAWLVAVAAPLVGGGLLMLRLRISGVVHMLLFAVMALVLAAVGAHHI